MIQNSKNDFSKRLVASVMLVAGFFAFSVEASIPDSRPRTVIGGFEASLELPSLVAFADELEHWAVVAVTWEEEPVPAQLRPFELGLNEYRIPTEYRLFARPPPKRFVLPKLETRVWGIDLVDLPQAIENKRFSLGIAVGVREDPLGDIDSPNLYAYVRNSPFNMTDPLGERGGCPECYGDPTRFNPTPTPTSEAVAREVGAAMVEVTPGGMVSDWVAFSDGYDHMRQEELGVLDQGLTLLGVLPGVPGAWLRKSKDGAVAVASEAGRRLVELGSAARERGAAIADWFADRFKRKPDASADPVGGAHGGIPANGGERHHMPADSVSPLSKGKGPTVRMETPDHRQTASWGSSREARAYRAEQARLIAEGRFLEAQAMDIDDLTVKFGEKYKEGMEQMREYTDTLDPSELLPKGEP